MYGANFRAAAGFRTLDMLLRRLALLITAVALAVAPSAHAAGPAATKKALQREMARAGGSSGAYVVDLGTGQELYASKADVGRMPASVNKLYTSATALLRYGADGHLTTSVLSATLPDETGTITGNVVIRGGGDPMFNTASTTALAKQLAGAGLQRITGRVIGDESAFDAFRGVPASGYRLTNEVGPLSALAFNHGRTGKSAPYYQASPAKFTADAFEKALEKRGREDHRLRPRGPHAGGDDPAERVRVPADRLDRQGDEPAERQLHRRDADQGPRRAVRRPRAAPRPAAP